MISSVVRLGVRFLSMANIIGVKWSERNRCNLGTRKGLQAMKEMTTRAS